MSKQFFVMKAKDAADINLDNLVWADYMLSTKLDGQRCLWDGGVTRGMASVSVPWSTDTKASLVSSGLWSSNGKAIICPDSFVASLPPYWLDGELYLGRGQFQPLRSIVSRETPQPDKWANVAYKVFDAPSAADVLRNRDISEPNCKKSMLGCYSWYAFRATSPLALSAATCFLNRLSRIPADLLHPQIPCLSRRQVELAAMAEVGLGGEGVMLRHRDSCWLPERTNLLLKFKPTSDMEGVVIGWTAGRDRLVGKMGALVLRLASGVEFNLGGGFDVAERDAALYPLGTVVTFTYSNGFTAGGVPKEARFLRVRGVE